MDVQNNAAQQTILVVDDNKNNLDLMLATLSEYNYRLLAATSGERALKVVSKVKPDLVLMDIQMPEMDGFETTRKLKSNPDFANVPVLFLSALNDLKNIVTCFEAGGVDYISKPFQKEELLARISTHLKLKELQAGLQIERDKIIAILQNILPSKYITQLKAGNSPEPQKISNATVIFTDFENFTGIVKNSGATESVHHLNEIFWAFDEIMYHFGLERVKTIGDSYMAVGGVNMVHADIEQRTAMAALRVQEFIHAYNKKSDGNDWKLRIGVHHGPIVAGIIGYQKIAFDVWGDTVNYASRLETAADTNGIAVSESFYQSVSDTLNLTRKEISTLHNMGKTEVYFCDSLKESDWEAHKLYHSLDMDLLLAGNSSGDKLLNKIFDL